MKRQEHVNMDKDEEALYMTSGKQTERRKNMTRNKAEQKE
jgi:hypothetical protein